jgi:hypothetical protein
MNKNKVSTSSKEVTSFLIIIPNELWIEIFSRLSPVDLCFSVPSVCKLFYELSSDNAIWSKYKAKNWSTETLKTRIKRNSYIVIDQRDIFKKIYIQWIREQVPDIKNYLNSNNDTTTKKSSTRPPVRNSLSWLQDSKRQFNLVIAGKQDLADIKPGSLLIKNHPKKLDIGDRDALYDLTSLFNPNKMNITLQEHNLNNTRWGAMRGIDNIAAYFDGIFWCATNELEKPFILYARKRAKHLHFIVIDVSPLIKSASLPSDFKNWAKENDIDFIEYNALDTALNRMLDVLNSKFDDQYPKYLPTKEEFSKFVFNGARLKDVKRDPFLYWF